MTRTVPEWVGKTDNAAVPPRVKARVTLDQAGVCACGCGVKLGAAGEPIEFDHKVALINGGENRETNLQALRKPCHDNKTKADVATKSKIARVRSKALGFRKPKSTIPGSKDSKWKRTIDGRTVRRGQ